MPSPTPTLERPAHELVKPDDGTWRNRYRNAKVTPMEEDVFYCSVQGFSLTREQILNCRNLHDGDTCYAQADNPCLPMGQSGLLCSRAQRSPSGRETLPCGKERMQDPLEIDD